MNQECQTVNCNNIGKEVRALITINGIDEIQNIFMCRNCITELSLMRGISN